MPTAEVDGMGTVSSAREQYVVDAEGRRTAILLPLERYHGLMEDLHDLAVVIERRTEEPIPLEQMEHQLKEDGLL
jgi:hypothetical protein